MAILLTTEYQLISTIYLTYGQVRTYAKYSSQDRISNKTYYQEKSTYYTGQSTLSFSRAESWLDGTQKMYGYTTFYKGETLIQEVSREITHYDDGTSPTKNIGTSWDASFGGSGSTSVDVVFPKILRYPQMTGATDFTDEENPSITFTNQGIFPVRVKINNGNNTILYRDINQTATDYTFELTNLERDTLRTLSANSKTLPIRFIVCAMSGSTELSSSWIDKTMTIVNATPTFTYTMEETNAKVISALGTDVADDIVQNASQIGFTITPTAYKNATISRVEVNNSRIETSPYEITIDTIDNIFDINVIDSRGFQSTIHIEKNLIEYESIKINSFNFERENSTSSNIILDLDCRYYQTSGITNTPVVKWKLNEEGTYTTIPSSEYSIDTTNNKLTISNYEITDVLPYTQSGKFYISVEDIFTSDSNNEDITKGIPTFDYGEHDLQVNGDLFIADIDRENKVNVKNLHKVDMEIDGSPVKTGRTLDGRDEYIVWQSLGYLPDNTFTTILTNINVSDISFVTGIGGVVNRSSDNWWSNANGPRQVASNNICIQGGSGNGKLGFFVETGTDRSNIYAWGWITFTYSDNYIQNNNL